MSQTYSPDPPPTSGTAATRPPEQAGESRGVRFALFALWAVLTAAAAAYVAAFGLNAPLADEWEFVPVFVGQEPVGPWLWEQHNEHRFPLPRLVFITLFRLTHDFRAGMLLQVAVLSVFSLWLMRLAARLRGRPDWPDAFFPVSLLHTGHFENLLLGYQVCFVLFCVLATALAVVALRTTRVTAFGSGLKAGSLLLLAELSGGSGLALVPPVGLWLVYLAVVVWRGGGKGKALVLLGFVAAAVAYLGAYFAGYERPAHHPPPSRDPAAVVLVAGQVLSMALGFGVRNAWWVVFAAELVLGLATVAFLVRQGVREPDSRPAAAGLVAVAAGLAGLAAAVGAGRASMGAEMGLWPRYAMQSWPLLAAAYLAWLAFGSPAARKWVPAGLCVAAVLAFLPNTGAGILHAAEARKRNLAMEADARAGAPPGVIVGRYFPNSRDEGQEDRAIRYIPLLREAGLGIYAPERTGSRWWALGAVVGVVGLGFGVRWFWHLGKAVMAERARELFRLQHERFEEQLLKAAGATGLPRGLRWAACAITGDAVLARDLANGGIVALVPVLVGFEPEADSDMADNPAAREPRPATAVFTFRAGTWETAGRVLFNHTPEQAVAAFAPQFRVIHHGHH